MKKIVHKSKFSLMRVVILLFAFFVASLQVVYAQGLGEELKQVEQNVKDALGEVGDQLSGENGSSPTSDPETLEVIKKRLEKTVNDSRVNGVTDGEQRKRGFVGEVVRISEEAVTVSNGEQTNIVSLEDTKLLKDDEEIELDEIIVGNWVTVLGLVTGQDSFEPKFIVVSEDELTPSKRVVALGSITAISNTLLELQPRNKDQVEEFRLVNSTDYQDINGEETDKDNFEVDTNVLVVGTESENSSGEVQKTASTIRSLAAF